MASSDPRNWESNGAPQHEAGGGNGNGAEVVTAYELPVKKWDDPNEHMRRVVIPGEKAGGEDREDTGPVESPFAGEPWHGDARAALDERRAETAEPSIEGHDAHLIGARHRLAVCRKELAGDEWYRRLTDVGRQAEARSRADMLRPRKDGSTWVSAGDLERLCAEAGLETIETADDFAKLRQYLGNAEPAEGSATQRAVGFVERILGGYGLPQQNLKQINSEGLYGKKLEYAVRLYANECAHLDYESAREGAARAFLQQRVAEERKGRVLSEEAALELVKGDVFKKYVVDEKLAMNQLQVAEWPPQKKAMWKRGLDWYLRQPRLARIAATTVIFTGGSLALGATLPAAAMYGSYRFLRSMGASFSSQLVGGAVGRLMEKHAKQKEKKELSALEKEFAIEKLKEVEKKYEAFLLQQQKEQRRHALYKGAAMVATGAGATMLLPHLSDTLASLFEKMPSGAPATGAMHGVAEHAPAAHIEHPSVPVEHPAPAAPETLSEHAVPAVPAPEALPHEAVSGLSAERLAELSTVHEGEGAWQAVHRQLEEQLLNGTRNFGLRPEDIHEGTELSAKVKQVLDARTLAILRHEHFIGPNGETLEGVHPPGTHIILNADDSVSIEGGHTYTFAGEHAPPEAPAHAEVAAASATPEPHVTPVAAPAPEAHITPGPEHVPAPPPEIAPEHAAAAPSEAHVRVEDLPVMHGPERFIVNVHEGDTMQGLLERQLAASEQYHAQFANLPPTGKAFLLHALEKQASYNAFRMGFSDVAHLHPGEHVNFESMLRGSTLPEQFQVAEQFAAMPMSELHALEALGFPENYVFDQWGYLEVLRHVSVDDYLSKFLFGPDGTIDHSFLGHDVQFMVGKESIMPKMDEHYLKLAEKLHALRSAGGGAVGALELHEALQRAQ